MTSIGQAVAYALQALRRGDANRAGEVADRLVRLAPQEAAAWDVFACAFADRKPAVARAAAKRALVLDPTRTLATQTLALREAHADPQRAVRRLARGLVARPATPTLWILLTRILWPLPMNSPFASPERRAVLLDPGSTDGWLGAGHWSQAAGGRDAAARAYLRAAILEPASALPLYHLGIMAPKRIPAAMIRATRERFAAGSMLGHAAELAAFALAYHCDATGDEDGAFAWLQTGNVERRRRVPPEMPLNRAILQATLEAPPEARPPRLRPVAAETMTPIFIIGLPGSGTTLVESMLSRHPEVAGGGELPFVDRLAKSLAGFPTGHLGLDDGRLDELAAGYLASAREALDLSGRFFTDKMPNNFMHVGLIRSLFPAAPIVHLSRDPMAVGWSLFRRRFEVGQTYSSSLDDIAEFIAIHSRYMTHWERLWPGGILDLRYERLIADPEAGIRRILERAGLPWDPACLDHAGSKRRVATASATAVRSNLDKRRIGDWRRYARHLEPLRQALLRHGVPAGEEIPVGE